MSSEAAADGTTEVSFRTVQVWDGKITMRVQVKGSGDPILYLHPAGGMGWDSFLDDLATDHTVYAPEFPGMTPGMPEAINHLDDVFDIVLAYDEALCALGLSGLPVIGQSFGGMVAAELAASFPARFTEVVLLDPAGLWMSTHPYALDPLAAPPDAVPAMLFHDPGCAGARAMFAPPPDPESAVDGIVQLVWAIGCAAKFMWPLPDRGLESRSSSFRVGKSRFSTRSISASPVGASLPSASWSAQSDQWRPFGIGET